MLSTLPPAPSPSWPTTRTFAGSGRGAKKIHGAEYIFPLWPRRAARRCRGHRRGREGRAGLGLLGVRLQQELRLLRPSLSLTAKRDPPCPTRTTSSTTATGAALPCPLGIEFDLAVGLVSSAYVAQRRQREPGEAAGDPGLPQRGRQQLPGHAGLTWTGSDFTDGNVKSSFKLTNMSDVKGLYLVLGDWQDRAWSWEIRCTTPSTGP